MGKLKGKVYKENIADKAIEWIILFGGNRNVFRQIPFVIDGLKPVQLRILYNMYKGYPYDTFEKVQDISGTTVGKYHPHGGGSVTGAIGNMANPIFNNIPFIDGHGNFGSINGDEAGAERYIEAKISKFGYYCYFKDFDKNMVDMRPTYNGKYEEPEFLPARYPAVLLNGSFSNIGTGLASNIPPYNFKEICETTLKLIKNPKAKVYMVPDSPTGCDVIDNEECRQGFKTGLGKVTFQATYEIDYYENTITITSLPPTIKLNDVEKTIATMKREGKLPDLKDHDNLSSNRNGMKYILTFYPEANLDANIENLMKSRTDLRKTFPIGVVLIDNYQDHDYNIPGVILAWLKYRREFVRSSFNHRLVQKLEEKHMNDVKLFVFGKDRLQKTLNLAKTSANQKEYMERLRKEYEISSLQADVISKMRTCDFNKDALDRYRKDNEELTKEIAKLESDIDDPLSVDRTIIEQLQEGIKLFGSPRRSRVINPDNPFGTNEEHLIGISEDGYVKKVTGETTIGKISKNSGQKNMVNVCMSGDKLLIFDSAGRISWLNVSDIPDSKPIKHGIQISKFAKIHGKIVAVVIAPKQLDTDMEKYQLVFISSKGNVKKISMTAFIKAKTEMLATIADEDNELVTVLPVKEGSNKDIIMYTNFGDGIRISLDTVKIYGRTAKGAPLVSMRPNEQIVGADKIAPGKDYLFYLTNTGKAKLTKLEHLPVMKKKDIPLPLINLEGKEHLVGICSANKKDRFRVYRKSSDPVEISTKDIKVSTRAAKAEKVVKTPKGDSVVGFELI